MSVTGIKIGSTACLATGIGLILVGTIAILPFIITFLYWKDKNENEEVSNDTNIGKKKSEYEKKNPM